MEQQKIEIISIAGMCQKFKVSHMTIYRHYLPQMKHVKKVGRKRFFLWEDAEKVHKKITSGMDKFKIIA